MSCEHEWQLSGSIYGECGLYYQNFVCQKCMKYKEESVEELKE